MMLEFFMKVKRMADPEEEEEDLQAMSTGLQQLLDDLARNALQTLPDLKQFGDYFSPTGSVQLSGSDKRRYWRVRMRVLTAIANCRSLVSVALFGQNGIGLSRDEELLILLRGLASNPVLRELAVEGGYNASLFTEAACVALGQLLACSRSLRKLSLPWVALMGAGLAALPEGFNKDSVLEELDLRRVQEGNARGVHQLARILVTAPQLKRLRVFGMDVAGAQVIANALPLCTTLQSLEIGDGRNSVFARSTGLGPMSTLLKFALTQADADGNGSVRIPRPAACITDLKLRIGLLGEAGLADALSGMLRTNACIQRLETTPYALIHGLKGLRHNSTICELRFFEVESSFRDEEAWMSLVPLLKQCKALRVLSFQGARGKGSFKRSFLRALLIALKHNASLTELNIDGWPLLDEETFGDLMQTLLVNRTLRKISIEQTLWKREGKGAILDRALARNATEDVSLPLLLGGQGPVMAGPAEVSKVVQPSTSSSVAATSHPQLSPLVKPVQYPNKSVEQGNRRGLAVVVSMEEDRPGGAVDRGRLEVLLQTLKFDTDIVVNDSEDIKAGLKQIVKLPQLAEDDCFLYCINAHGGIEEDGREYIFYISAAKKEKLYVHDDILKPITECRYLAKKPKVIIINACRGTGSLDTNRKADNSADGEESQVVSRRAGEVRPLHSVSDCLVVFSTSHGVQSFRDAESGSNFIVALMEAMVRGYQTEDVLSILTSVVGKVTEMEVPSSEGGNLNEKKFQCPELYSTLTRKLYWS